MTVPSAKNALRSRHVLIAGLLFGGLLLAGLLPAGLLLAAVAMSGTAAADNGTDAVIYRTVLKTLVGHEKTARFAIYGHRIAPAALTTPRVPRHAPDGQLARSLPGVGAALEQALTAPSAHDGRDDPLPPFDAPDGGSPFSGVVGRAAVRQLHAPDNDLSLVVGFSKIAYDKRGRQALVYAEVCRARQDGSCGGEGFWLVRVDAAWRIKRHAYLWQGGDRPFWQFG